MQFSSTARRLVLGTIGGTFLLATIGSGQGDNNPAVKQVLAGAGLSGGGKGPVVTLSIASGGITPSMLSPAAISALQGAPGPQGPAGPAGPQGPAGPPGSSTGGGAIVRNITYFTELQPTTIDGTPYGFTATDDGVTFSSMGRGYVATFPFTNSNLAIVQVNWTILSDGNGPQFDSPNLFVRLLDSGNNVVGQFPNPASTTSQADFLLANGFLKLNPGNYTLILGMYDSASVVQVGSNWVNVATDPTRFVGGTFKVEVLPQVP